ncbi:GntR family transcriptional regulator [Pikeienuella piscinae]|uniref:GntR family transcriptional regulator n=1 Tax=Pikeienuella piscinae TaxID=2748098 RepID=A0A7M3T5I8_9RHOB|nr:GntR family transcriptional regulator [Pikeienuella piscinae]QIE57269.1 GntR family transcriptional regulator [Pikeienuella piscinae]
MEYLREGVFRGRYAPGQRLVEADLTAELGVSRSLLREAFHRLAAEGTIELVPNRGALVRRMSLTDATELFDIRMELEALAARRAARNAADRSVRRTFLADTAFIYDDMARLSASAYIMENQRFHGAMFVAADNRQLIELNMRLQLSLIMAQISSAITPDVIATSLAEHRAIAEAIAAVDEEAADAAIRAHLARAKDMIVAMPAEAFRRDPNELASLPRAEATRKPEA